MPERPGSPKTNFAGGYCRCRVRIGQLLSYKLNVGDTEHKSMLARNRAPGWFGKDQCQGKSRQKEWAKGWKTSIGSTLPVMKNKLVRKLRIERIQKSSTGMTGIAAIRDCV